MNLSDIEKVRVSFYQKYGVNLGRSGALFLAIIINQGKSNEKIIQEVNKTLKENLVTKSIHFQNKQEAFFFGLGISFIPSVIFLFFGLIVFYCC